MSGLRPWGISACDIVCGTRLNVPGLELLVGRADPKRAFAGDDIDPFLGVVMGVRQPRIAKLMQCRRSRCRASEQRILSTLAPADEVLLEKQRNGSELGIAWRTQCCRRRGGGATGSGAFEWRRRTQCDVDRRDSPARSVSSRSSVIEPSRANRSR